MFRLNRQAFERLKAEVLKYSKDDFAVQVQREIALKRWEKLLTQEGTPLTFEELCDTVDDLFPDFSKKVLKSAARANRPPSPTWNLIRGGTIALVSTVGAVWFLNLPFPMIRYPVARTIPVVLLPSYISMDHHYRQAITLTEQADQLINRATSPGDLDLGATKLKAAQKSLDALPVWFLGYYPRFYCSWFRCAWGFTLDEFQSARQRVGQMKARLFQEYSAQTQLQQAEQAVVNARQQYQEAAGDATNRHWAIAQWRQAIDQMQQIPPETLAGRMVQPKLAAYERDIQTASSLAAGAARTGMLIAAAQEFARTAQQAEKEAIPGVAGWEEIQSLWRKAIERLQQVREQDPNYLEAQKLMATYERNLGNARIRQKAEQSSVQAYEAALRQRERLYASIPDRATALTPSQVGQLQQIVIELKKVQPGTTVYAEAQVMLKSAEARLK
ncbi:hypothetical protein J5X98_10280 [Leptothermofonsia sichuanensis E412]|uniref:hypothetical protein n=1 Tax=Leptothermofonsia sichuanensis TaxID=2917832 RepID=UPI001CA6CF0A|nr:hypothetical protein [Leptothermofonsia sichuanensis]QZZ22705.1 hypothetical protein J5X98_10280 [Leptothermofonsia sichuanensis E412]